MWSPFEQEELHDAQLYIALWIIALHTLMHVYRTQEVSYVSRRRMTDDVGFDADEVLLIESPQSMSLEYDSKISQSQSIVCLI